MRFCFVFWEFFESFVFFVEFFLEVDEFDDSLLSLLDLDHSGIDITDECFELVELVFFLASELSDVTIYDCLDTIPEYSEIVDIEVFAKLLVART